MSNRTRAIVHLDLDAFFAAVEVLENPELEGKPVIVGGRAAGRGVVATASYAARAFGVHSAMPTFRALNLCPDAIVLAPRHRLYQDYSQRVMAIVHQTSSLVEQVSIDEAFLDLTDQVQEWKETIDLARELQNRVSSETHLSSSLGVATNKLLAKVASDHDKPGGLTVVHPGEEAAFLAPLPVRVLWGVGPVTERRLAALGVTTVAQLAHMPRDELQGRFGRHGTAMIRQARGADDRPVVTHRERKSVGQERTFAHDLGDGEALQEQLVRLSQRVAQRLQEVGLAAGTVTLKIRYADFTTLTRQMKLSVPTDDGGEIARAAHVLLNKTWERGRPVRLLGVAGHNLAPPAGQMPLL